MEDAPPVEQVAIEEQQSGDEPPRSKSHDPSRPARSRSRSSRDRRRRSRSRSGDRRRRRRVGWLGVGLGEPAQALCGPGGALDEKSLVTGARSAKHTQRASTLRAPPPPPPPTAAANPATRALCRSRSRSRERRRRSRSRSRGRRRRSRSRERRRRSRSHSRSRGGYSYGGRRGRALDPTVNFHDPFAALRSANAVTDPAESE